MRRDQKCGPFTGSATRPTPKTFTLDLVSADLELSPFVQEMATDERHPGSMTRTERYELIVIGAGQAGLALGYWLAKQDVDFLIVDANARVGDSWRKRWDSLRLFTPAKYSGLPGLAITGDPYHLPTRDEIADYLEWYSQVFELPIRHNVRVSQVTRSSKGFSIETDGIQLEADNVVVATGPFQVPSIPGLSNQLSRDILQLHSSEYRNPAQLPEGPALVVGAANSGAQIALELAKTRDVMLAGRSVGSMRRRVLGRDVFDWLYLTVMRPGADSFIGRRIRKNVLGSTDALIGMTEKDLTAGGVRRVGRVTGEMQGRPALADGAVAGVASIIWATGFRPDFSWIDAPIFGGDGFPIHRRGVTAVPGLYFVGLRFQHRLNSSLIGGAGEDARFIAESIAARYGSTRSLPSYKVTMSTKALLKLALLTTTIASQAAHAQKQSPADTVTPRFTIGSTQIAAGYVKFDFADLDARMAAAGLPRAASGAATFGIGADIRSGAFMLGVGFQSLIAKDHSDASYRTRLAGRYSLVDFGVAVANTRGWSVYPIAGLGASAVTVNVRERGTFTFDEGLQHPAREVGMSGLGALAHGGILIERRFHRGDAEYALGLRAGVTRGFGSQAWTSDASKVEGGPTGLRGSYARLVFSRPLRHRRDALVTAAGTVAQAAFR